MKSFDEIMSETENEHPYKNGDRSSYYEYNEGWQDACDCIRRNAAELIEQQQKEIEQLKAKNNQIAKDRDQWKRVAEASRDVIQPKLRAEIEELKAKQPRWIPVREKLPSKEGWYLAYADGQRAYVAFFKGKTFPLNNHYHSIAAWQPLPEPYKGEEE